MVQEGFGTPKQITPYVEEGVGTPLQVEAPPRKEPRPKREPPKPVSPTTITYWRDNPITREHFNRLSPELQKAYEKAREGKPRYTMPPPERPIPTPELPKDVSLEKAEKALVAIGEVLPPGLKVPIPTAAELRKIVKLPDDIYMGRSDIEAIKFQSPELYKVLVGRGYVPFLEAFEQSHIKLRDGKWVPIKDWNELPEKYQSIGLRQGFDAMRKAIKADEGARKEAARVIKRYRLTAREAGEVFMWSGKGPEPTTEEVNIVQIVADVDSGKLNIKYPDALWGVENFAELTERVEHDQRILEGVATINNNLALVLVRKIATEKELRDVGFDKRDVDRAVETVETAKDTGIAVPGDRAWQDLHTRKTYTDAEHQQMVRDYEAERDRLLKAGKEGTPEWAKLGLHPANVMALVPESGRRIGIELASFIIPPARAALPEYTLKDISAVEWGLGAVNAILIGTAFAPGAIMGSLTGRAIITGVSATGAGLIGYETKKNWAQLTPVQRGLGTGFALLYALPMLITVGRGFKITVAKPIPTAKGEIPAWKGLSIANHPIIGRSGGRFVIGARNITLPEARLILDGYKPEMMLETKVFVNSLALRKAGISQTQIDYLTTTLRGRNLFAGQKSPFLAKEALLEPTQRLNVDEINILLRIINKYNKKIKQVDMLYGSATIKPQLAPELRGWRAVHDWDISTKMSLEETLKFAKEILRELQKLAKGKYRINPKTPTLIEKKIKGEWKHIADIHSSEKVPGLVSEEIPKSKLDVTGDYSYGRMVAEPAITVEYPGVGKFDIMTLSESGVRKADTILRVRQTPEGTAFRPPERGIASPGVPKDAADFYVILRTFKGEKLADEWLKSWAKAMGYTTEELAKALPRMKIAALEIASETPSSLIGYRLTPASTVKVAPGASPSIIIHIPSSLGASVVPFSSLGRRISSPISPYAVSPSIRASLSASIASIVPTRSPAPAPSLPSIVPSLGLVSLPPSLSPSLSTSPKPSSSPLPSPTPVPSPSPTPSPKPSPVPTPIPSPVPVIPVPKPKVRPKPVPRPKPSLEVAKVKRLEEFRGAIAWRQGFGWWAIKEPYESRTRDVAFFYREPPPNAEIVKGGLKSAYKSIQLHRGKKPPTKLMIDMGIMDVTISSPVKSPGKGGAIVFKRDVKQATTGDISLSKVRGESSEGLSKLPLGTTLKQLLRFEPEDVALKEFAEKYSLPAKLRESNPKEIAKEIKDAGLDEARVVAVLKHLPDRERNQVRAYLDFTQEYAPTRGTPKAKLQPIKLRRVSSKHGRKKKWATKQVAPMIGSVR